MEGTQIGFTTLMSAAARCAGALLVLCWAGAPARAQDDPPARAAAPAQDADARRPPACDDDDGGLQLPAGFCALVVADDLGTARHLAVAGNGDVYVALADPGGGVAALRDADGDGRLEHVERFGDAGGTGIQLRDDYLYFAPNTLILRYRLTPGALVPKGAPERVVAGFPDQRSHAAKPFEIDADGWLYVNVGAPSNACQPVDRAPGAAGAEPCDQLDAYAGVWRFRADELNQAVPADGKRYATGIRNGVANAWNGATGKLYVVQHGRDQLAELWPEHYDDRQRAELPAEEMFEVQEGDDFGWPYCYYDPKQQRKVLAPEYGGDGQKVGRCEKAEAPLLAFPAHWAPNDLLFYTGTQFPERYRGGAFIAFHGSWNRQPYPQQGFRVVFAPFRDGRPAGEYETFADGFAGGRTVRTPAEARYRPAGLALGPDGSLYVSDSRHGRIWRVLFRG